MLDKLDYSLVPNDFALCFNGKCLHASTCLRSGFMDDSPLKNAYGMEHLLDNIPYRQAKEIRREMREYFGTTHFYRLKRKERCFTPEDQLYVRDLLRQYNIEEEPLFDRYEENFGWERCSDTIA